MQRFSLRLLVIGTIVLLTAPAAAASPSTPVASDARGHWTSENLARAIPRDVSRTGGAPSADVPAAANRGKPWTGNAKVRLTTGKVFFTQNLLDYVCSGSTVNDGNGSISVVLTAGHCVEAGTVGFFSTNFVYVPDYERWPTKSCVTDPSRCFPASRLVTSSAWADSGNFDYDVGFAVVNGNTLETTWGTQAIGFNLSRLRQMYSFGYPAASPYNGQKLIYCNGRVQNDVSSFDHGMKCNMTGGSSGGPWYINFNPATGVGTANSLNSFKYSNDASTMYGPYFGNYAQAIYSAAVTGLGSNTKVAPPPTLP